MSAVGDARKRQNPATVEEWADAWDVRPLIDARIEQAKAEERERIASAIEITMRTNPDCRCCRDAARIARTVPHA